MKKAARRRRETAAAWSLEVLAAYNQDVLSKIGPWQRREAPHRMRAMQEQTEKPEPSIIKAFLVVGAIFAPIVGWNVITFQTPEVAAKIDVVMKWPAKFMGNEHARAAILSAVSNHPDFFLELALHYEWERRPKDAIAMARRALARAQSGRQAREAREIIARMEAAAEQTAAQP